MESSLYQVILDKPRSKGIVVIITNDYSNKLELSLPVLPGTQLDGQNLYDQFNRLEFAVCWKRNVGRREFEGLMSELRSLKHNSVKTWDCIIFIFSGHGCEGHYLRMQDGTKVNIDKDIITPLLPKQSREIGSIPKIFLIDACRGDKMTDTVLVPRGCDSRGGEMISIPVPAEGGFLVAFSTMPKSKAYEDPKKGGIWLSTLAEELESLREKSSIDDILTEVNGKMARKMALGNSTFQQPEKLSRLNTNVYLIPCGNSSHQPLPPIPSYTQMLSRARGMSEIYAETQHYNEEYKKTYYHYTVTLKPESGGSPLQYESSKLFLIPEHSKEDAARVAFLSITETTNLAQRDKKSITPAMSMPPTSPNQHSAIRPNQHNAISPSLQPDCVPNSRSKLNTFFQKHGINPKYKFDEDHSTGKPKFKCTIIFMWNGKTIRPDSGSFYPRKDDAKERASINTLSIVGHENQPRGGASATSVSWKSCLKEFYDKRGQPEIQLCYRTEETKDNDFVSHVYIPELRREVTGALGRSKKDAEQSAADQSLQLLQSLK